MNKFHTFSPSFPIDKGNKIGSLSLNERWGFSSSVPARIIISFASPFHSKHWLSSASYPRAIQAKSKPEISSQRCDIVRLPYCWILKFGRLVLLVLLLLMWRLLSSPASTWCDTKSTSAGFRDQYDNCNTWLLTNILPPSWVPYIMK